MALDGFTQLRGQIQEIVETKIIIEKISVKEWMKYFSPQNNTAAIQSS